MPVRRVDPAAAIAPVMPGLEEEEIQPLLMTTMPEDYQKPIGAASLQAPKQFELRVPHNNETVSFKLPADEEVFPVGETEGTASYWVPAGTVITTKVHHTKLARVQRNLMGEFWIFFAELSNGSHAWVKQQSLETDQWTWESIR